jgi:hypothetical protein
MWRLSSLVLAGALLAGGCSANVSTAPTPTAPVRVTVTQNPTVAPGAAVFTLRVENISASVVNLTFPSSCQVVPYFTDRATGRDVPRGFACATVITQQTLSPGASFSQTYTVTAGSGSGPQAIVLPPGDYAIYARLEDMAYKLTSEPVPFTLR